MHSTVLLPFYVFCLVVLALFIADSEQMDGRPQSCCNLPAVSSYYDEAHKLECEMITLGAKKRKTKCEKTT